jgi:hypothetical protein
MKILSNKSQTVNKAAVQHEQNKAKNLYVNYRGEITVKPIMFNPTQEDFDKLGVKNLRLFGEDHYKNTTKEGESYTKLSLLFEFSPAEELGDKLFPAKQFGTYTIAISNDDLIKYSSGVSAAKGTDYAFWSIQMIDERFNTLEITVNEDPKGQKVAWFQDKANEKLEFYKRNKVARTRSTATTEVSASDVDLKTLSDSEIKMLAKGGKRFNPATASVQKQGYYAYSQLILSMSALNITYFDPLDQDIKFDAKEWSKLVSGDVSGINRRYEIDSIYFYSDAEGNPDKTSKPKLGVFMYTKLNNGYFNQEVLCPSYPGMNFDATFGELTPSSKISKKAKWTNVFSSDDVIKTRLDVYDIKNRLFGISYDGKSIDESRAIITYPYDFSFDVCKKDTATPISSSNTGAKADSNTTPTVDPADDLPF